MRWVVNGVGQIHPVSTKVVIAQLQLQQHHPKKWALVVKMGIVMKFFAANARLPMPNVTPEKNVTPNFVS